MGSGAYLLILFIGAVIVVIDGQLILRTSAGYLAEVYDQPRRARQVSGLATVLFHLIMLGVVALVASIPLAADTEFQSILARIGVLLLLTGLGHGVTIAILSRLRQQQLDTQIAESQFNGQQPAPGDTHPPRSQAASDRPVAEDGTAGQPAAEARRDSAPAPAKEAPADEPGF